MTSFATQTYLFAIHIGCVSLGLRVWLRSWRFRASIQRIRKQSAHAARTADVHCCVARPVQCHCHLFDVGVFHNRAAGAICRRPNWLTKIPNRGQICLVRLP